MSAISDILVVTRQDGIVTWRLNRPDHLNALNADMAAELSKRATEAVNDDTIECLVITGTGRAFSAGGDLPGIRARAEAGGGPGALGNLQRAFNMILEGSFPIITAINGVAAGAGFGLALLGDISIASMAARFRPSFIAIGATPDLGLAYTLPRLIGEVRAREALLTNREFSAEDAAALNMITRVVPADQFEAEVLKTAQQLAAAPRMAYGLTRQLIRHSRNMSLGDFWQHEMSSQLTAFRGPELLEGATAFLEKRKPDFRAARKRGTR